MSFQVIGRVAVEDEGDGPTIVCVHGLGGSSNTFTPLMPALSRHRVVRLDLPGSGRSQRAEGPLSIAHFVDNILSICTRLNIDRAHWIGHSMGTIVCQHIAAQTPQLVKGLTLFGPLLAPPDSARVALKARAEKARTGGASAMQDITQLLVQGALSAETKQRSAVAVAFVRESLMRQEAASYANTCEALADAQAADVSQITAPVQLITGDEDTVAPPQAVRAMGERFHSARSRRVVVLPRCGHWTPIEKPEDCSRELSEFLAVMR